MNKISAWISVSCFFIFSTPLYLQTPWTNNTSYLGTDTIAYYVLCNARDLLSKYLCA